MTAVRLPGLERLATIFGLSPFERDLVALCAASDLGLRADEAFLTLGVALAELTLPREGRRLQPAPAPQASAWQESPGDERSMTNWAALTPASKLRKLRLLEVSDGPSLAASRIRIPERVFHFLLGNSYVDATVDLVAPTELVPSHAGIAKAIAESWGRSLQPVVLVGPNATPVAAGATDIARLRLYSIKASALGEPREFAELWNREALLLSAALLVEADVPEPARELARLAQFPLIIAAPDDLRVTNARTFEVRPPTAEEGESIWRRELGERAAGMNGELRLLAGQFRLSPDEIRQVAGEEALWEGARKKARQALDGLAQRIESRAEWDDLVLPDAQTAMLRQLVAHVRQRAKVYHAWGFAGRSDRGLGIGALFAGPSGTGKTLASEVVSGALGLDLYRIDLSAVVSKYIGETEKNLRRIFEAAEGSGAVLLFDEADALFGKRSEVKDSHDRYANIEVSYLLQKMEAYSGLVVLTTNLKGNLDPAFIRRLRFIVQFPFPEHEDRRRIWEGAFPVQTPKEELDFDRLAGLSLSGGSIRNVALNAAFLAAEEGSSVGMSHLRQAARGEFAKLERPMTEVSF